MPRPETAVRVTSDPAALAAVRAAARDAAAARGETTPGQEWSAARAVLDDPAAAPTEKANAALRLNGFGDPAGAAYLIASLSDPSPAVRLETLDKLGNSYGARIDLPHPDRLRLLELIDDPDPTVARNAHLAALWWRQLPGAADRVATRVAAGTAPNVREWAVHLAGRAETADHVRVALPHLFPPGDPEFANGWYPSDLERTLAHPDPAVREPVRRALLAHCLRFRNLRGEQGYIRTLAAVADESTVPFLEEVVATADDPFVQSAALGALVRLRPAEAVDRILAHATRARHWTYLSETLTGRVTPADAGRVLAALSPTALAQSDYEIEHLIRLCLSTFGAAGRRAVEGWLPKLSKRTRAVAVWGLEGIDLRAALEAFAAAGVLPRPVDEVYAAARREKEKEYGPGAFDPADPGSVVDALHQTGIAFWVGGKADERPAPHDELVMTFGRHSGGGFAPECAVQVPGEEEPDEDDDLDDEEFPDAEDAFDPDGPLRVQFIHAGRVYEFDPENYGGYHDVSAVAAAANRAVADAGRPERFFEAVADGAYVFADPARFLPVARRLGLPHQYDAD